MVNPTTYALARLAGITDDAPSAPTGMGKIRALNNLLDEVQSRPEREQDKIFRPYFVRFAGLPEMRDLIYHQANRMAQSAAEVPNMPHEIVGQFAQFLSTLLVMQDPSHVAEADKTILLRNLRLWSRRFVDEYEWEYHASQPCFELYINITSSYMHPIWDEPPEVWACDATTNTTMSMNMNPTPESLAALAGLINYDPDVDEGLKFRVLKGQLGMIQTWPRDEQTKIHSATAAKYLPAMAEKFRTETTSFNGPMVLLNIVSYTPYYVRFMASPAGQGIAALQTKRVAAEADKISTMSADDVAEIGQFLATILLLQGIEGVDENDKKTLIPKLRLWQRSFPGRLASETSMRCFALLTDDPEMREPMAHVRSLLTGVLQKCQGPSCGATQKPDGGQLMQCSRCKSVAYCGQEHQKQGWPSHKSACFKPAF
ncbi:hypothetical protein ONZ45_g10774 [Pleurotus djamor]|nr:hypothetical protein ONZ45_g10774 [Pleurotus djamor]